VEAAKAQVRSQLSHAFEDRKVGDVAYFLGQLLDLDFPDSPLVQAVSGDAVHAKSLRAAILRRFLEKDSESTLAARGGPLVLVMDDLHAAHDESLDLLAYLFDTLDAPALIVCVGRSELIVRRDRWSAHGGARHLTMELPPLSEEVSVAIMEDLLAPCGGADVVRDLAQFASSLAGGNPSLLEQTVRLYLDSGVVLAAPTDEADLSDSERWTVVHERLADVKLPLTVEDAVAARIAALASDERAVLEVAAAIGSVFWVGALVAVGRAVSPVPEVWTGNEEEDVSRIRAMLGDLEERDYVLRLPDSAFPSDDEYVFKHNLEREALIRLTPAVVSRDYHRTVADWLGLRDQLAASEEHLSMLGSQRERAQQPLLGARAYLAAGDAARERYAYAAAARHYEQALELFARSDEADVESRLRAHHHLGDVLERAGDRDGALTHYRHMLELAFRLRVPSKGGAAHGRIGRLFRERGAVGEAERHLEAARALYLRAGDERGVASTLDDLGKLHWMRGDLTRAMELTQAGLAMRKRLGDARSIALSLNNLGLVYQDAGKRPQAREAFEQSLSIRREVNDLVGVSVTLNNLGTIAQDEQKPSQALTYFLEAYEVAKETGDRQRIALVLINLGETYAFLEDHEGAVRCLAQARELMAEQHDAFGEAEALRGLGKAYAARKELARSLDAFEEALRRFETLGNPTTLAVARRDYADALAGGTEAQAHAARDLFESVVSYFQGVGNELELARTYRSYSDMLKRTPAFRSEPTSVARAYELGTLANEIYARLRSSHPPPS
jgi:tetratricopeptide (TPR) repeat protein